MAVFFVPFRFFTEDLPQAAAIAAALHPWQWNRFKLVFLLVHVAALGLGLAGLGLRGLEVLGLRRFSLFERRLFSVPAGAGLLGLLVLGSGLTGLVRSPFLIGVQALLGLNVYLALRALLGRESAPLRAVGSRAGPILFGACALYCLAFLAADLLAPEAFWDALVYHLGVPKRYLEAGRIVMAPAFFGQMPLLASMNFLFCLWVRGEILARGFDLMLGGVLAAAVWKLARNWFPPFGAWLAAALAVTSPLLGLLAGHANSDMLVAVCSCLAVLAFIRAAPGWPRGPFSPAWLIAAGLLAGQAAGAKLPGLAVPAILALLAAPLGVRAAGLAALPALLVFLPWALRSWLWTGNPLFPFFGGIFPSPFWGEFSAETYGRELAMVASQLSFSDFSLLDQPLVSRFKRGLIGPVPLLALLGILFFRARERGRQVVLLFAAGLAVLWAVSVPAYRFYAAGFALLPLLLPLNSVSVRIPVFLALLLQAAWYPLVLHQVDRPWGAARGEETREQFYAAIHANPSADAFYRLEKRLPTGPRKRALLVGEVRNFLAPPWSIAASYFDPAPFLALASGAQDERRLMIRLKQMGVGYLLVNAPETMRLVRWEGLCWNGPSPEKLLALFFSKHAELIFARHAAWLYDVGAERKGAALPECFRNRWSREAVTAASLSSRAVAAGRNEDALRLAWAAVAADDQSGLSWAALGDGLFLAGRHEAAIGAYERALVLGWRTSAVYHNYGVSLAEDKKFRQARQAMEFAVQLDPEVRRLRRDLHIVTIEYLRPLYRMLNRP